MTDSGTDQPPRPGDAPDPTFAALGLDAAALAALERLGYEAPTPIQAAAIPALLAGRDVLGQAQTGTGKTAAFALPLLQRLDGSRRVPQLLVLTPTRELALQVATACEGYAAGRAGLSVLAIYGGQPYPVQERPLRRGVQVVVGTPGRVMDHLRRGSLSLADVSALVLDEADEMLAMGFLEDVTAILEHVPEARQTALFSATMPGPLRRIAERHLDDPVTVTTARSERAAATVRQRHLVVRQRDKLEALLGLLEVEPMDGLLVFVRTKTRAVEMAEALAARGHAAGALNGDMAQALRERTVGQFKDGRLDILVATDVAARGLDVERVSHVLNLDMPSGSESYVHRIGRTGRAGRTGEAILFVAPKERRLLHHLARTLGRPIPALRPPSLEEVNARRVERFLARVDGALERVHDPALARHDDDRALAELLARHADERGLDAQQLLLALARLALEDEPLLLDAVPGAPGRRGRGEREGRRGDREREGRRGDWRGDREREGRRGDRRGDREHEGRSRPERRRDGPQERHRRDESTPPDGRGGEARRGDRERGRRTEAGPGAEGPPRTDEPSRSSGGGSTPRPAERRPLPRPGKGQERFRVEVGYRDGLQPGQLVAAIAGETGLDGQLVGRIEIYDDHTLVDLPLGMPKDLFKALKKARLRGRPLRIRREGDGPPGR